jgi:hypothetical protein
MGIIEVNGRGVGGGETQHDENSERRFSVIYLSKLTL